MALVIDDPLAHQALLDLASEYEAQAQAVERRRKSDLTIIGRRADRSEIIPRLLKIPRVGMCRSPSVLVTALAGALLGESGRGGRITSWNRHMPPLR
jgi:hypothetical protein